MLRTKSGGRHRALLLVIVLAGMALRAWRLGAGSLWYDETVSVFLAGSPLPELLRHTAGDIHPPGYYLLLRAWLILTGYPTGHADPVGHGLEFASAFLSLCFGVLLIALAYVVARRLAGAVAGAGTAQRTALLAAALVALSPYNVWYSQEVRMYTLGAALGLVVLLALWEAVRPGQAPAAARRWWLLYALAAAAGMYTLYYFAFLLIPLNLWAVGRLLLGAGGAAWLIPQPAPSPRANAAAPSRRSLGIVPNAATAARSWPSPLVQWLVANLAALALYAPWLPVAWRQATQPPVPPWRTAAAVLPALRESWTALSAGQSAPAWLWPAVLLLLPVYLLGLAAFVQEPAAAGAAPSAGMAPAVTPSLARLRRLAVSPASLLALATFGALALVLVASAVTPLYHVRYVFTYSPAFYIAAAASLTWLWPRSRPAAPILACAWLAVAGLTLYGFWYDPAYQPDDHRSAVAYLQSHWRPGDAVIVNAGYAYTALATYWQAPSSGSAPTPIGPDSALAWRGRLTGPLPDPRGDDGLVVLTTGHVDGSPQLGWGDPRSDFFAMPAAATRSQIAALFTRFNQVWQYRIYDTVNDPRGVVRQALDQNGTLIDDQVFAGEAFTRVQGYVPRQGVAAPPATAASATAAGFQVTAPQNAWQASSGSVIYPRVLWRTDYTNGLRFATSLRLVGADGRVWAQPPDDQPFGPLYGSDLWRGGWQAQTFALPIPAGTPPGRYTLSLVVYHTGSGAVLNFQGALASPPGAASGPSLTLGAVEVRRTAPEPSPRPAVARFGPLALLSATTPATQLSPGDSLPVDLLWQAASRPGEPLVVVLQLLDGQGKVVAGLEAQPVDGRYPTQLWETNEIVRDPHTLALPKDLAPGTYRLIAGVYRASDGQRLQTAAGPFAASDHFAIKTIEIRP